MYFSFMFWNLFFLMFFVVFDIFGMFLVWCRIAHSLRSITNQSDGFWSERPPANNRPEPDWARSDQQHIDQLSLWGRCHTEAAWHLLWKDKPRPHTHTTPKMTILFFQNFWVLVNKCKQSDGTDRRSTTWSIPDQYRWMLEEDSPDPQTTKMKSASSHGPTPFSSTRFFWNTGGNIDQTLITLIDPHADRSDWSSHLLIDGVFINQNLSEISLRS